MSTAQRRYVRTLRTRYGTVRVHTLASGAILASFLLDRWPVTYRIEVNGASRLV